MRSSPMRITGEKLITGLKVGETVGLDVAEEVDDELTVLAISDRRLASDVLPEGPPGARIMFRGIGWGS